MIDKDNVHLEIKAMYDAVGRMFLDQASKGLKELLDGKLAFPFGTPTIYRNKLIAKGTGLFILMHNSIHLNPADDDRPWTGFPLKVLCPFPVPEDRQGGAFDAWVEKCVRKYAKTEEPDDCLTGFEGIETMRDQFFIVNLS